MFPKRHPQALNESTELTLDVKDSTSKDWPLEKPLR